MTNDIYDFKELKYCLQYLITKVNARKKNEYIKSPINYTGNKYRILSQLMPYFPEKINTFVDLFTGGATVGLNVDAKKVIFIDKNTRVISLLKYLSKQDSFETLLEKLLILVFRYKLSLSVVYGHKIYYPTDIDYNKNNGLKAHNSDGFYKLRNDYNSIEDKSSDDANIMLYILMVYGFNNDMRFSNKGEYNLPVGKTDLNLNNIIKLRDFIEKCHCSDFEFIEASFDSDLIYNKLINSDYIYMDPPYLITNAVYNESKGWREEDENNLLILIDKLNELNIDYMLSNVLEKKGKINSILNNWITRNSKEISVHDIDYHYRNSSYNKINRESNEREIIVIPRRNND